MKKHTIIKIIILCCLIAGFVFVVIRYGIRYGIDHLYTDNLNAIKRRSELGLNDSTEIEPGIYMKCNYDDKVNKADIELGLTGLNVESEITMINNIMALLVCFDDYTVEIITPSERVCFTREEKQAWNEKKASGEIEKNSDEASFGYPSTHYRAYDTNFQFRFTPNSLKQEQELEEFFIYRGVDRNIFEKSFVKRQFKIEDELIQIYLAYDLKGENINRVAVNGFFSSEKKCFYTYLYLIRFYDEIEAMGTCEAPFYAGEGEESSCFSYYNDGVAHSDMREKGNEYIDLETWKKENELDTDTLIFADGVAEEVKAFLKENGVDVGLQSKE